MNGGDYTGGTAGFGRPINNKHAALMRAHPTAAELIAAERQRQIVDKGRTAAHDDQHTDGSLLDAAVLIAGEWSGYELYDHAEAADDAPWQVKRATYVSRKYESGDIRKLVIAGAMIAVEIDRLLRSGVNQSVRGVADDAGRTFP